MTTNGSNVAGELGRWLEVQSAWQQKHNSWERNEFIVYGAAWEAALPSIIDAVYISAPLRGPDDGGAMSRRVHRDFLQRYPELSAEHVPLVAFDPTNWDAPFSVPPP